MFIGIFFSLWISRVWAEPPSDEKLVQNLQDNQHNVQISEPQTYQINQPIHPLPEQSLAYISDTILFLSTIGIQPIDSVKLQKAAIQGMLHAIDQDLGLGESRVLSKSENHDYISDLIGLRQGYGMSIRILEGKGLFVESVFPGGEAFKAGVQPDDIVIAINNHSFTRLSSQDMLHILNEPVTTDVRFDIERNGQPKHVRVKKGKFRVDNLTSGSQSIRIHYFGQGTSQELEEALQSNVGNIILDLRDNSGGLLTEVNASLGLFIGEQKISGYRKFPDGSLHPFYTSKERSPNIFLPNLPKQVHVVSQTESKVSSPLSMVSSSDELIDPQVSISSQRAHQSEEENLVPLPDTHIQKNIICLINKGTRGVAELFVSTLRNHGKVVVIGETSAGFAADEYIHPISEDIFLKMAYIELLDSNQKSWNSQGIKPDVLVHSTKSISNTFGQSIDIQLSTAIQIQNSD